MPNFLGRLKDLHEVQPNISGKSDPPELDAIDGAWTNASKSQHALLLLEESKEGSLHCKVPSRPRNRFRLGQVNFTSLRPRHVVAFRLWCAAKNHNDQQWLFLPEASWHLAFRLYSNDVDTIKKTFEGHSLSGIEFRFKPMSGELSVYTQQQCLPCRYLQGGLLLNNSESHNIGFEAFNYGDATRAIREFLAFGPLPKPGTESN